MQYLQTPMFSDILVKIRGLYTSDIANVMSVRVLEESGSRGG